MAVYVDPLIDYGWKLGPSCHLTADTIQELNLFASKIGMKLSWIQGCKDKHDMPHYDLTTNKRAMAVSAGAIELTLRQAGERYHKFYITGSFT